MKSILLIDDNTEQLSGLQAALTQEMGSDQVQVLIWKPSHADGSEPLDRLESLLSQNEIEFVVTDYDLTSSGSLGFYGSTVVDQCKLAAIPVGDYSRRLKRRTPTEPNLFEIKIPIESHALAARYISGVFHGFSEIRSKVAALRELPRSPVAGIATILDRPNDQNQYSLYGARYSLTNSALRDRIEDGTIKSLSHN